MTFTLDRLETNPRFAAIARPANAAILVKLRIDMEDRGGRIELLLPYATLEPIRKMLLQQFMGEKFGRDNIWESHLATELWTTQMEVRAVLDEQQLGLRKVLDLKVGDTLMLNATPDSLVELRAGAIPLTRGRMGRRNAPHRRPGRSAAVARAPGKPCRGSMSIIALGMNLLLAGLLVAALVVGLRLNRRLKALRDSHDGFAKAVRELNAAAARAEQGLADLRAATDEATDDLADRIEKGRAAGRQAGTPDRPGAGKPPGRGSRERRRGRCRRPRRRSAGLRRRCWPPPAKACAERGPVPRASRAAAAPRRLAVDDDLFEDDPLRRSTPLEGAPPMKNMPRILPLVGVAIGGVLAVNALAGARDLPEPAFRRQGLRRGGRRQGQAQAAKAEGRGEAEPPPSRRRHRRRHRRRRRAAAADHHAQAPSARPPRPNSPRRPGLSPGRTAGAAEPGRAPRPARRSAKTTCTPSSP